VRNKMILEEEINLTNSRHEQPANETTIKKATIVADHTLQSFSLYEIRITGESQEWTILRRYSWFRALHLQLNKEIQLRYEFPALTYFGKLDPTVVASRKKGLEEFLNIIISNKELLAKDYVASFFLPVRCLTTFMETSLSFRSIKESRICFIDPLRANDAVQPQLMGTHVDYDHQTLWQYTELNQLQTYDKSAVEILEIRKELLLYKQKKRLTPLQEDLVKAYTARLKVLNPKTPVKNEKPRSISVTDENIKNENEKPRSISVNDYLEKYEKPRSMSVSTHVYPVLDKQTEVTNDDNK